MLPIRHSLLNALLTALLCLAVSGVLLGAGYALLMLKLHPELAPFAERASEQTIAAHSMEGRQFTPIDFVPVRLEGRALVIERYGNNQALLRTDEWVEADHYPFVRVEVAGIHRDMMLTLFWQRMGQSDYESVELNTAGDGSAWFNLANTPGWSGRIVELGVGARGRSSDESFVLMRDQPFTLKAVHLVPFSRRAALHTVWQEWTAFEGWTHTSMNRYWGVPDRRALVRPNAAFGLWLLGALLVLLVWVAVTSARHRKLDTAPVLATALALVVLVWAAQDSLRVSFRVKQAMDTHTLYAGQSLVDKVTRTRLRCDQMQQHMGQDCRQHPPLPHL